MELIDLELYKWKWFHDIYINHKHIKELRKTAASSMGDFRFYWKEAGAFVSTLPRQTGKTRMLVKLAEILGSYKPAQKYLIITPNTGMKHNILNNSFIKESDVAVFNDPYIMTNKITRLNHGEYNLLIEEYQTILSALDRALMYPWKTVTMVGTLEL